MSGILPLTSPTSSYVLIDKPTEATTYELVITTANTASSVSTILATQLLTPLRSAACTNADLDDDTYYYSSILGCSSNTVDITSVKTYFKSDGPNKFTTYCLVLTMMSIFFCFVFTPFLPSSKDECQIWKAKGEAQGDSSRRGLLALVLAVSVVLVSLLSVGLHLSMGRSSECVHVFAALVNSCLMNERMNEFYRFRLTDLLTIVCSSLI